ncbi:MAG TPA: hypothetical protein VD907_00035 [Verrucomicrobiae bacterium]|nr:hypothetical protein [Verrucomicrobiae bacterium]
MSKARSPLHPKALVTDELTEGRKVIWYNVYHGVFGTYEVVLVPVNIRDRDAKIILRNLKTGTEESFSPTSMGVIATPIGSWNDGNIIIDANDKSDLPTKTRPKPNPDDYLDSGI